MENREILWKDRKRLWCGLPWTFTSFAAGKLLLETMTVCR